MNFKIYDNDGNILKETSTTMSSVYSSYTWNGVVIAPKDDNYLCATAQTTANEAAYPNIKKIVYSFSLYYDNAILSKENITKEFEFV